MPCRRRAVALVHSAAGGIADGQEVGQCAGARRSGARVVDRAEVGTLRMEGCRRDDQGEE